MCPQDQARPLQIFVTIYVTSLEFIHIYVNGKLLCPRSLSSQWFLFLLFYHNTIEVPYHLIDEIMRRDAWGKRLNGEATRVNQARSRLFSKHRIPNELSIIRSGRAYKVAVTQVRIHGFRPEMLPPDDCLPKGPGVEVA